MDTEISKLSKASGTSQLSARVWDNPKLSILHKGLSIVPMFAVLFCTAAKGGPYQMCRRRKLTCSTNNASVVFLELGGNITLPTKKGWDVPFSPICTPPFAGLVMFCRWSMCASQRIYCTVSWLLEKVTSIDQDQGWATSQANLLILLKKPIFSQNRWIKSLL